MDNSEIYLKALQNPLERTDKRIMLWYYFGIFIHYFYTLYIFLYINEFSKTTFKTWC